MYSFDVSTGELIHTLDTGRSDAESRYPILQIGNPRRVLVGHSAGMVEVSSRL